MTRPVIHNRHPSSKPQELIGQITTLLSLEELRDNFESLGTENDNLWPHDGDVRTMVDTEGAIWRASIFSSTSSSRYKAGLLSVGFHRLVDRTTVVLRARSDMYPELIATNVPFWRQSAKADDVRFDLLSDGHRRNNTPGDSFLPLITVQGVALRDSENPSDELDDLVLKLSDSLSEQV